MEIKLVTELDNFCNAITMLRCPIADRLRRECGMLVVQLEAQETWTPYP